MNLKELKKSSDEPKKQAKISFMLDNNESVESKQVDSKNKIEFNRPQLPKKKKNYNFIRIITALFSVVLLIVASFGGYFYYQRYLDLKEIGVEGVDILDPLKYIVDATAKQNEKPSLDSLQKENGKTNVLLVGIDARFDGSSWMTDSIIIMSYDHAKNSIFEISIPRDMKVKYGYGYTKINSVFPFTYANKKAQKASNEDAFRAAFDDLSSAIKEVTGITIHYGAMINFQGFKEVINQLGGVDILVENSFTDWTFPNDTDTGVIKISFQKSDTPERMDGNRALQFARSRHGDNGEGSDYARARRQQKVINAVKDKFLQSNLFTQADSLNKILEILGKNLKLYKITSDDLKTAITARELLKTLTTSSVVLDPNIGSYSGQLLRGGDLGDGIGWVLYPVKNNNFSEVIKYVDFVMANPGMIDERASVMLIYTDSKRYKDYAKIRNLYTTNYLSFENSDAWIRVIAAPTVYPTTTTADKPFISIYTNGEVNNTVAFYKELLEKNNITYQIRSEEELPIELTKLYKENNVLFVVD